MFPNPTENWLMSRINDQNAAAKVKAAADLATYQQHIKEWEAATIQSQYNNAPIPAPPAMPTITEFYDGGGWIASRIVVNPAAQPPILPALPTVGAGNTGIVAGGHIGSDARDAEMFRLLYAIAAKLGVQ